MEYSILNRKILLFNIFLILINSKVGQTRQNIFQKNNRNYSVLRFFFKLQIQIHPEYSGQMQKGTRFFINQGYNA